MSCSMRLASLVAGLLWCVPAIAEQGEAVPRWPAALMSGETRLAAYSLLREAPAGSAPLARKFADRMGLRHEAGQPPVKAYDRLSLRPIFDHDRNVNGGLPGDGFELGGLRFEVDEEARARSGVWLGAGIAAGRGYSIAPGRTVSFEADLSHAWSPATDRPRSRAGVESCLGTYLGEWSWIDLCTGARASYREDLFSEGHVSASYTKLVSFAGADHAVELGLEDVMRDDHDRGFVSLAVTSAVPGLGALRSNIRVGERVEGHHGTLWDVSIGLTRKVAGRTASVNAGLREAGGDTVFDIPREDLAARIGASLQIDPRFTVGVGYEHVDSSLDVYDDAGVTFSVGFTGWSR